MNKPKIKGVTILKIALVICIVLLLHVANICRFQYQTIQRDEYNKLASGYYYITNPDSGISTWNTEALWHNNTIQLAKMNIFTIENLPYLPSANERGLEEMISALPYVPWDSELRPEIVAKINDLKVTNNLSTYKWEMILQKGNVQEINDLISRSQNNPPIPATE